MAKAAGVDPSTVSRVLNNDKNLVVRAETRNKILKAVRELNYRPNATARSLKTGSTSTIGMVLPNIYNPAYRDIFLGVEEVLERENYFILSVSTDDQKFKKDAYLKLLEQGVVDGVILAASFVDDEIDTNIHNYSIPIVAVNRFVRGLGNYVLIDDKGAAKHAVEHLIKLGHRKIAHLSGPLYANTAIERFQGYRIALQETGIEYSNSMVIETDYSEKSGYESMKKLLANDQEVTAVFATNIRTVFGAMAAIQEGSLKIPADISIICVHDLPMASLVNPPLTTVKLPLTEMGREAAEILLRLIRKEEGPRQKMIQGYELILRGSTAPPKT